MLEFILLLGLHLIGVGLMQGLATVLPPWLSLFLAWLTLWLLPGFMLWRMVSPNQPHHWFYDLPFVFNLGLAWLMGWAIIVLFLFPFDLAHFNIVIIIANSGLGGGYFWFKNHYNIPSFVLPHIERNYLLFSGALATLSILLTISWQSSGFTFEGDEWSYLLNINYFLATSNIDKSYFIHTLEFDIWNFILTFLLQFAPTQLLDLYGLYLPALFIIVTCLAYLTLSETLFERPDMAYFALTLQGLYWLSNINLLTADNGLGLLARLLQDKFSAFFLVLPLIQICGLKFLQTYQPRFLIMLPIFAIVAVLIHPIAIMWLLFSMGGTIVFVAWQHRQNLPLKPQWIGLALALIALAGGLAWWQRSIRPNFYFSTQAGDAHAITLSTGRVLFLSMEQNIYMAHPTMLLHPLTLIALLLTITLIPQLKTKLTAQYLFANSFWVLLILFNPITASILGRIISFWIIYRIVWILPVSLTLTYVLYPRLEQIDFYLNHRLFKTPQLASLLLLIIALTLSSRISTSWYTLNAWQPYRVTATELDMTQQIKRLCLPNLMVLAPHEINVRLTATAPQIHPTTARLYGKTDPIMQATTYFFQARRVDDVIYSSILLKYKISYILTRHSDPIETQLQLYPHVFSPLYTNTDYTLYEWQADSATPLELSLFQANGLLQQGQLVAAQSIYESILQQESQHLPAILGLGEIYQQQLQYTSAISLYQTAQPHNDFEQALLLTQLTQARYLAMSQPIEPKTMNGLIEDYRQALEFAHGHAGIYQQVLANYQTLSQVARQSLAGQALRYALLEFYESKAAAEPNDFARQQKLADIYRQVGETELALTQYATLTQRFPEQLELYFAQAEILQEQEKPDLALQQYEQALAHEVQPSSGRADLRLAQFYQQQQAYPEAKKYAQEALATSHPEIMGAAYLQLGQLALAQNDLGQALDQILNAVEIQPSNAESYVELGHIYDQQNDPETALGYYRQAITQAPGSAYYHLVLGQALLKAGQAETAWAELAQAIRLDPMSSSVYQQVGALQLQYASFEAAQPYLQHALKLDPANGQVYLTLAQLYRQRGEWGRAHETLNQALTITQDNALLAQIHAEQAQIYLGQQNKDAALAEFLLATQLAPRNPWIYGLIGDFYLHQQGDLTQAESYYRQALLFPPRLAWVQVSLGEVLLKLGEKEAATNELTQVMGHEEATSDVAKRVRQLAKQYQISELY